MNSTTLQGTAQGKAQPDLMTITEACEVSRLSKRTIGRMCARGDVRAVQLGKRWLINRADFMALLAPAL